MAPWFSWLPARGTPLDLPALVASAAGVPGSQGTVVIGETVLGWLLPRGIDRRLRHTPSLPVRETYFLILWGRHLVWRLSRGVLKQGWQGWGPLDATFALPLCLTAGHQHLPEWSVHT